MSVKILNSKNFQSEVLNSDENFLIDFYADWCGPCKMLAPVIDNISNSYSNINVAKINIDENSDLARKYNVLSIPTLLFFKQGKEFNRITGFVPEEKIVEIIKMM